MFQKLLCLVGKHRWYSTFKGQRVSKIKCLYCPAELSHGKL